jgi:hypothetical protein
MAEFSDFTGAAVVVVVVVARGGDEVGGINVVTEVKPKEGRRN